MVLCVIGGSLTPSDSINVELTSDKLVHVLAYFAMMAWFGGLYRRSSHWRIALALCFLGIALEWLQQLGGARQGDLADVLANTTGIALGLVPGVLISGGWCRYAERILAR